MLTAKEYASAIWNEEGLCVNGWDEVERVIADAIADARAAGYADAVEKAATVAVATPGCLGDERHCCDVIAETIYAKIRALLPGATTKEPK